MKALAAFEIGITCLLVFLLREIISFHFPILETVTELIENNERALYPRPLRPQLDSPNSVRMSLLTN